MKLQDISSREEQNSLLDILDKMIQEYENAVLFETNTSNQTDTNNDITTSEYFSVQYNSNLRNKYEEDQILSREAEIRANALRQAKKIILQNEKKQQLYVDEKIEYTIFDVLELDRKRISSDLHDSTVQILTMLVHKAEFCEKIIEKDTIRTKMELSLMSNVLKDAISELRQTIFNLRPMSMDDLGLMDSIERYLQILIQSSEVTFLMDVNDEEGVDIERVLSPVQKLSLYRILQECCSNIIKHSNANKALITLQVKRDEVVLIVEDNGKGFESSIIVNKINEINDHSTVEHNKYFQELSEAVADRIDLSGYGLSMLQERVYLLDGKLHINSEEKGCKITISIPIITKEEELNEAY